MKKFNLNYVYNFFKGKNKDIKNFLLDQKFVSGIGNIYASEILFLSKVNPFKKVKLLTKKECLKIIINSRKILLKAISKGGSSIRDFKDTSGLKGGFQNEFKVYPNPSIDIWNITGTTIPIKQIIVYDLIGKEVFTSQPNELHTVINGQNFSSGIYFANLVTSQGRLVVKLIKD